MDGSQLMFWPHRKRRELDQRIADARADTERSRRELERTRQEIVAPIQMAGRRNHFSDLIRASLLEGGGRR